MRTPLTSIAGSLGLVSGGVAGELPPKATQLVEIAARNCARLVRLIDDILDTEKAAAGKLEFDLESQPLEPIVAQAIEANREYAHRFGVRLLIAQSCPGVWVRVDRDRLIQVLTNLISNAAKFSPAGAVVSVGTQEQGPQVRVWVKDAGAGIPESFRDRIFQPFAQRYLPRQCFRGHEDHRDVCQRRVVPHAAQRSGPVHARHHHIEEEQVGTQVEHLRERTLA